jgi:microcin C transport system substrate-binding protein
MPRRPSLLISAACLSGAWFLAACHRDEGDAKTQFGFDEFRPVYNQHIADWVSEQQQANQRELDRVARELTDAREERADTLRAQLTALESEAEKWRFRLSLGDYLKIATPADIPEGLTWETGMDEPEIGDPAAIKGGAFRRFIQSFPPTIRPFGENSNNSFRGDLYDMIDVPLVNLHPETMAHIPGVAHQWAVSEDGRTVYFKIDPEATYSDGVPVRAMDFLISTYLRVSDHIINPYSKQYFRENIAQIAAYDESTLSVSLHEAKLFAVAIAGGFSPSPPHFYQEYGPDYNERYQWKFPPTTGAYKVLPEDIVMGTSITQTRVENWWARDRKYYRHRYNPDKITHTVVRDESKAFELFRAGQIDTFYLTQPQYWYEKSEMPPVYKGWIERVTFYNRYPKVPRGLYMNVIKPPLDNRDVRIGIHYAMNWRKVIDQMFRGDFQRLNAFNEGYILFSDPSIRSRPYSIKKARERFRTAGYTEEDPDGILRKPGGERLSVSVTYMAMPLLDRMFAILREDAKACGLDLRLDGLEATVTYKKVMQKQHDMNLSSWLITPPMPDFYQFLHSSNAFDDKGNPKPQTNNIFSWARTDSDALSEQVRTGTTIEEVRSATHKLQRIMHDEGFFVPGYSTDFIRIGSWRWVRWPDSEYTRFSPPVVYDPHDSFVFWIDGDMQRETNEARRANRSFGESTRVIDTYRDLPPEKIKPAPAPEPIFEPEPEPEPEPAPTDTP